jgi:hypothetical protein
MTSSCDSLIDAEHITHTHELLTHVARRAQDRPAYVAWALAPVQVREGLSDDALATRLGLATGGPTSAGLVSATTPGPLGRRPGPDRHQVRPGSRAPGGAPARGRGAGRMPARPHRLNVEGMPTRSGQGRWSKGPIGNLLAQEETEAMSPPTCIAYHDDGTICRAPATILDHQRGGMVCL